MRFLKLFPGVMLSLAIAACGGSSSSRPAASTAPTTQSPTAAAADPSCPVAVAGTSVTVEDAATGAALVFVTTGDVTDVRRRAAAMAAMHNEHHGAMGPLPDGTSTGGGHEGHDMSGHAGHGGGGASDPHAGHGGGHAGHGGAGGAHANHAGGMIGVHSKAIASDIEGGAKVTFVVGAADVAKLQSELRMHAQHMSAGTCSMGSS